MAIINTPGTLWKIMDTLVRKWIQTVHSRKNSEEKYEIYMKYLVFFNPRLAVGQIDKKIGENQLKYLKSHGLNKSHTLLDYGCGTLRAGVHFIHYLYPNRYTGYDLSKDAIKFSRELIYNDGYLTGKLPSIYSSWVSWSIYTFDFIIAQSVITHTDAATTQKIFQRLASVMKKDSKFFCSYWPAGRKIVDNVFNFTYTKQEIKALAGAAGLRVQFLDDYEHPSQDMLLLTKGGASK